MPPRTKKTIVKRKTKTEKAAPAPKVTKKRGFMSNREVETLKAHLRNKVTIDEIALRMNRSPDSIKKKADEIQGAEPAPAQLGIADQLMQRPEWKKWQLQFTTDELEQFKTHYIQMMGQFENNVKHTEELQIFQVITLIILIDRTLAEEKRCLMEAEDWRQQLEEERAEGDDADQGKIAELQAQYEMSRAASKQCSDKYRTYSDKQDKILQQLKATRDQRVKNFEQSDKSFLGLLRWLTEEENRSKAGREAELMRAAAQKEKARMGANHKYRDGTIDRPLLTPETVVQDDEE
jgi:hypothetical protein